MDEHLRQQLKARLEFYEDLGIQKFYRRSPRSKTERAQSLEPHVQQAPALPPGTAQQRAKLATVQATIQTPKPIMPTQRLSLFEAAVPSKGACERETLEQIREDLGDCQRCRLATTRKTIVFGQGNPHAELVFVGEGPGADEDEQGLPFVGRAGQLLNRMIQFAGMKREEVYICNIVKCRPPGNRVPEKDEIEMCSPFLLRQIAAIQPRLVCCLGAPAVRTLLGIKEGITKIRGTFYDFAGTRAIATVHPAYILRNPREEKILREDFEKIRKFLQSPR
ncbi:MAG TPA: uracil-DNA glycosylase [Terriglobia bacterium]|nr:uracil-DNA glycosylase [Terriglobia bacterium]